MRDNLRLYRPEASDAEIKAAARAAQIHEVIAALDGGYGAVLSENGEQLSGGQRQRLALARALVSTAPVLVLDEVTSALDDDTAARVMAGLAEAARDRTLLLIAHRETACAPASRWLRLQRGKVEGSGHGAPSAREFIAGAESSNPAASSTTSKVVSLPSTPSTPAADEEGRP